MKQNNYVFNILINTKFQYQSLEILLMHFYLIMYIENNVN